MITDSNHACFAKMATCGFQEEVIGLFTSYTSFVLRIKKRRAGKLHFIWFLEPFFQSVSCLFSTLSLAIVVLLISRKVEVSLVRTNKLKISLFLQVDH
jgi:hypothetical protein